MDINLDTDDLIVGDRVSRSWMDERRTGTIAEVYRGAPPAIGLGIRMFAITWDDTRRTERGYLRPSLTKLVTADRRTE
jgi:hypothetical protein